jgi:hypothetical protein
MLVPTRAAMMGWVCDDVDSEPSDCAVDEGVADDVVTDVTNAGVEVELEEELEDVIVLVVLLDEEELVLLELAVLESNTPVATLNERRTVQYKHFNLCSE